MGTSEELTEMLITILSEYPEFDEAIDKMEDETYNELCEDVCTMVDEWRAE
jgi:hypothetical protein